MHDFSYLYGFDEVAGNFQSNNYGKGGTGNDYVFADAQDGNGVNNANFFTPAEGANPRMQMYIFTNANPDRDSDLDNGVIAHEYGHGISNRLTGGPANVGCLNNSEQMGEGWSDFFGLMTTMKPGDKAGDRRGIGNYALNQAPGANGFRPAPYTTDMSVNSSTYGTLPGSAIPHGVGYVWCTMLWEMTWNLIHAHGMETGYEEAMNLVMEGMKLQPCSPGFIDGRNAILAADVALYGGVNACLIWEAFARRGLGVSATQGSTNSINDGVQAFNTPNTCFTSSPGYRGFCLYPGNDGPVRYKVYAGTGFNGALTLSVSGLPSGASGLFFYSPLEPGDSAEYYMNPPYGAAPGTYLLTFTGFDGDIYYTTKAVLEVKASNQVATLTSPANMSTTQDLTPTLTWEQYPEALGYYLQVSTASNFSSYVVNTTPTNNSYTIPTALADNTTYYWRVFPNLGCIPNGTQTVRSFTTACSAGIIPPVLVAPADGATEVPLVTVLDWEDTPEAVTYGISVATDIDFTNIVVNASGLTTSTYATILSGNTTYYWRSTATYTCGASSPSTPFSFTTENVNVTCTTFASTDVPVPISASGTPTITSTLNIPVSSTVLDVNVLNLGITHTYINDLKVKLTSPAGTIRTLLDSPCSAQDNILINFDDESANNYGSYPCPPTNNGTYKPNQSLAVFDGQTTMGNWTLTVQDIASEDGGSLNAWSVNVCYTEAIPDMTCYQDSDGDTYGNLAQPLGFSGSCGTGYVLDGTDCDDAVGAVNPGATETCNGVDDNCDTFTDEGLLLTFYDDSDGDGYGNPASSTLACVAPFGYVEDNTDCDDTPGSGTAINPAAQEVCNSGVDDDCDGLADDADASTTGQPDWYQDFDGDGLGNPDVFLLACLQPVGYVPDSLDCNDNSTVTTCSTPSGLTTSAVTDVSATLNWTASPGAQRYNLEFKPASASSYGPSIKVFTNTHMMTGLLPGTKYNWRVRAVCDSLCSISSGLMAGPAVKTKYRVYTDADGDGFGDGAQLNYELISTFPAAGYSSNNLDCNDANSAIKPSATELCNGIDDDCDLLVDEGTTATTWYEDSDGDGLGNAAVSQLTCIPPSGYVSNAFDCNDQIVEAICLLPAGVSAEMISQYSASLVWQTSPCVSFYSIKYKKSTDPTWTNVPAYYGDNYPLSGLTPGSLYYYQVRSRCTATSPTTTSAWVSGSFSTLVLPMGLAAEDGGQGNHLLPEGNELEIYPNPGDGIFNLSMNSDLAVPATIKVTDVLGKLLLASTWPLDKGMNTCQLDLSLLAAGVYHLEIQRGEMKQAKKIVIVR
jgi:subtilisin-like proprotein convertase family protein